MNIHITLFCVLHLSYFERSCTCYILVESHDTHNIRDTRDTILVFCPWLDAIRELYTNQVSRMLRVS